MTEHPVLRATAPTQTFAGAVTRPFGFAIEHGEIPAFLGENGSGKSMLFTIPPDITSPAPAGRA